MSSRIFGYIFYGHELLVGTAVSLEPYVQEHAPEMHKNIDKLFQALHPFAVNGTPVRFLSEACVLKASWVAYDLSNIENSYFENPLFAQNNYADSN